MAIMTDHYLPLMFPLKTLTLSQININGNLLDGSLGDTVVAKGKTIIGRDQNGDTCISSPLLSLQHTKIFVDENNNVCSYIKNPLHLEFAFHSHSFHLTHLSFGHSVYHGELVGDTVNTGERKLSPLCSHVKRWRLAFCRRLQTSFPER